MMETSISPSPVAFSASNTPPNAMPDFSHANTNEVHNSGNLSSFPGHEPSYDRTELVPEYLRSALEKLPDISQPHDSDHLPMRETSDCKNAKLAGQARARPSSITSSAQSVEAPSPNNNHRHQPSAETRRPAAESTPGPALYHSRSPRSIGKDFRPTTGPIPTSFPQGNTSAHRNDASLNHPKPATSNFKHWEPPSVSSATPSPPRSFETDDSTPIPSQAEKRPRQDEPISETEGKRKKTNTRERTPKKTKNEFQPNPTILGWAAEDGKGEKDKFRAFYAPARR
ncbi:hypothetical protein M413DRAFT_14511 [Hebeloma cylindrosporum]|uniref:Uncharacterized protein n=1 Tax=Hebeloma cylindrosporum TaxID=76867 RepID=A0A0C3BTU2_HEBCY|nr:hypothetical protein M413DRAFT_14511 [Hebeloma cylindrosporum h7]